MTDRETLERWIAEDRAGLLERLEEAEQELDLCQLAVDNLARKLTTSEEENERLRAEVEDHKSGVREANGRWLKYKRRNDAALAKVQRLEKYGQPWYGVAVEFERALKGEGE